MAADSRPRERRSIARNKRATHEYLIQDELEVGVVLRGTEVKSLRASRVSLQEAYCFIKDGELRIMRMHIPEYAQGNVHNHEPTRDRVLEKGTTLVPLEIFWDGSLVKLRIGLARGKKLHDKRQSKREKDDRREVDRAMKSARRSH
ncbi:MAG: SsrA-binding protein SmpB [Planctomycetota bacterium]